MATLASQKLNLTHGQNSVWYIIMPLFLVGCCPPTVMLLWHVNANLGGSWLALGNDIANNGFFSTLWQAWAPHFWGSPTAWAIIGVHAIVQLILMKVLPGKPYEGTLTAMGNIPRYKDNGLSSYVISLGLFFVCSLGFKWFSPGIVYHHLGDVLGALNITALVFCLFLYFKGKYAPSSTDSGTTGRFLMDYYWGTELYPRIFGWDVKMFTNCRFGMTGWALMVISYAFAQQEITGTMTNSIAISAALISIYLFKFFIWESGYMRSIDIIVDRAGFYICWGCLVWVPALYTSPTMFMVNHPVDLPTWLAVLVFAAGIAAIFINYWADLQRQKVRATQGQCTVFGKPPVVVRAKYKTDTGVEKENLLLASGFWGISRHFHYIPELSAAFLWGCTTGFEYFMPFCYVSFLTLLLFHRAHRDDVKCSLKYGKYWEEYRKRVPYKIIPGIY